MHRFWDSQGRAGSGFGQSGLGLGRVFAYFESRVRVLASRVSGFCRVSNSTIKLGFFFEKKWNDNYFLFIYLQFMNFVKYFIKGLSIYIVHTENKFFGGIFLENLPVFGSKLLFSNQTKTRRVLSGFTVGFGWVRVSFWKSGSGLGLTKIVGCRVLGRVFKTRCITNNNL